jgi:hypothetical protein
VERNEMPAQSNLLTPLLRRLPAGLLAALDGWSYRVAQQRAQKRRNAGLRVAQERSGA